MARELRDPGGSHGLASHARSYARHRATTVTEHRPKAHQRYLEWTPSRLVDWAHKIGPATANLFEKIMASKPHPEQGYRSCCRFRGMPISVPN